MEFLNIDLLQTNVDEGFMVDTTRQPTNTHQEIMIELHAYDLPALFICPSHYMVKTSRYTDSSYLCPMIVRSN